MTESTVGPMVRLPKAAELLGVSQSLVRRMIHEKKLAAFKLNGNTSQQAPWLIRVADLNAALQPVNIRREMPAELRASRERGR